MYNYIQNSYALPMENFLSISKGLLEAKYVHEKVVHCFLKTSQEFDIQFDLLMNVDDLNTNIENLDMVIAIGGDGTFLRTASHLRSNIPIFGITSDPERSVGALCSYAVDNSSDESLKTSIEKLIDKVIKKEYNIIKKTRIAANIQRNAYKVAGVAIKE